MSLCASLAMFTPIAGFRWRLPAFSTVKCPLVCSLQEGASSVCTALLLIPRSSAHLPSICGCCVQEYWLWFLSGALYSIVPSTFSNWNSSVPSPPLIYLLNYLLKFIFKMLCSDTLFFQKEPACRTLCVVYFVQEQVVGMSADVEVGPAGWIAAFVSAIGLEASFLVNE